MKASFIYYFVLAFVLEVMYMIFGYAIIRRTQEEYHDIALLLYGGFNVIIFTLLSIYILIATKND